MFDYSSLPFYLLPVMIMEFIKDDKQYIDDCLSIARELGEYFTEDGLAKMADDLKKHSLFVTLDAKTVLGFASVLKINGKTAEITWMAVRRDKQDRGIGSKIIDCLVSDLRSQKFAILKVKTLAGIVDYKPYERTRKFYEKMGFIHIETIDP